MPISKVSCSSISYDIVRYRPISAKIGLIFPFDRTISYNIGQNRPKSAKLNSSLHTHRQIIINEFTKFVPDRKPSGHTFLFRLWVGEETMQPSVAIKNLNHILNLCQNNNHFASLNWFTCIFCPADGLYVFQERSRGQNLKPPFRSHRILTRVSPVVSKTQRL